MPKIRVTCTDPYATDSSTDDDDDGDESIVENKPKIGGLFVKEISVSLPLTIPSASTIHFDSLAKLKLDFSFRARESESLGDRHNCIVLALPARKSEDILQVQTRFQKISIAKKCKVEPTNSSSAREDTSSKVQTRSLKISRAKRCEVYPTNSSSSREDTYSKGTPASINMVVDIPVAKKSRSPAASMHPPDASFRIHKSKSVAGKPKIAILALPATEPEERYNSEISVGNTLEKSSAKNPEAGQSYISVAGNIPVAKKSRSMGAEKHPGLKLTASGKYGVQIRDPIKGSQVWLGSYSTIEEAKSIYNKKKLEFAFLESESVMEDASLSVDEPKLSVDGFNCLVQALSAGGSEDTPRIKSGNGLEKLPMAEKCQLDNPSSISVAKVSTHLGAEKYPGIRLRESGKFGVEIRDPITRRRIWLGTYNTFDEAKNIYIKKKLEYESSLTPTAIKHNKHSILKEKHKGKVKRKQQKVVIEGICVWETVSGKWRVSARDPVSKRHVWLASHATPEEAVEAYHRRMLEFDSTYNRDYHKKMLEFDSIYNNHSVGKEAVIDGCTADDTAEVHVPASDVSSGWVAAGDVSHSCIPAQVSTEFSPACDVDPLVATNIADVEPPVVKLSDAEKWRVAIRHPRLKNSLCLGLYDTAEEAEKVYHRNKLELDTVLHSDEILGSDAVGLDEGVGISKYKGVRTNGNGRWWSQIHNPFQKKGKVYLGTYKSVEEAAEVYKRTRCEFNAIISLVKKRKREAEQETHRRGGCQSKKKTAIVPEEAVMLTDDRTRLFEIVVEPDSCDVKPATTVANSQRCNSSNNDIYMLDEFGMGVIDNYGQLIGEYSRLDDELWLSRQGEDEEFDPNGDFFNGNGELAWDIDSKPSLN